MIRRRDEGRGASKTPAFSDSPQTIPGHLLSKHEVAAACGVSERTVDNWLAKKLIPQLRLSARLTRFSLPKVLAALARFEVKEVGARQ
jgi:predicted DNA-binding transcriptional regulator AlpA